VIYLLDTNSFSALMRREATICAHILALPPPDSIIISTITRGEILFGLARMPNGRRRRDLAGEAVHLFSQFACEPLSEAVADQYARIKLDAQLRGTPVAENDLWIASTTLNLNAILVSADSDFLRIPGLVVEDWTL